MNQRACYLALAAAILLVGGVACPAAYAGRGEPGPGLPRQRLAAEGTAFGLNPARPPRRKPASPRLILAHAKVVRSFPESGGVVAPGAVAKVEIWYSDLIAKAFLALAVINAAGDRVDKRDAALDSADGTHVSASVEPLTPGEYTVRYRAVSADTHLVSGAWIFEVRQK